MYDVVPSASHLLPRTLLDLLSNWIILDSILPYLPLRSIAALIRTSHSFRNLLLGTPSVFRHLDLSKCRGAYVPPNLLARIDPGGLSWRSERMDEHLTEDEFYSGPLRGVLNKLGRFHVLQDVHTLILDELASVTLDLVSDILLSSQYNVRLLSVRRCLNLNQSKMQQLLRHVCRPSRPEGTPRLQGLYYFTQPPATPQRESERNSLPSGMTPTPGAQPGATTAALDRPSQSGSDPWYSPVGRVVTHGHVRRTSWEETLQACAGVLSFDAVLCTHMHADMAPVLHPASRDYLLENKPFVPTMATLSLGPDGCAGCGRHPRSAPVWGDSPVREFPLLWPPPRSGKLVDAVRPPTRISKAGRPLPQRLIASCSWCLVNRHCDSCHRWWCADCYDPAKPRPVCNPQQLDDDQLDYAPTWEEVAEPSGADDQVKVFNGLCVEQCLVGERMKEVVGDAR